MSLLIWIDEEADRAIDLGDPLRAWSAFAEMARVAVGENWPELFGVPHAAEQEVSPKWLAKVRAQAVRFMRIHAKELGDHARWVLTQIVNKEE